MKLLWNRFVSRIFDRFLPSTAYQDLDFLRRSKLVIAFSIFYASCGIVFSPLFYILGSPQGSVIIIVSDLLILFTPFLLKKTSSYVFSGNWIVFNVFWLLATLTYFSGGEGTPPLAWNVSLPIAATLLAKRRSGLIWGVIVALEVMIYYFLYLKIHCFPLQFTLEQLRLIEAFSLVTLALLILIFAFLYESVNEEAMGIIRSASLTDELTQLHNRRGFLTLMKQEQKHSLENPKSLSLIFMDVDHFKQINDTYGHYEGDQALITIANILKMSLRDKDIIARIGGDEFVIAQTDITEKESREIIERLMRNLKSFNSEKSKPYPIELSSGLQFLPSPQNYNLEELLKKADQAMYQQKRKR